MSSDANEMDGEQTKMEDPVLLYSRGLPGGGVVTIEAVSKETPEVTARVSVERRIDPQRRDGHEPPVIAEAQAPTQSTAFKELYRIAFTEHVPLGEAARRAKIVATGDVRATWIFLGDPLTSLK